MYYNETYIAQTDIFSYMVFRKRRLGRIRRTIVRKEKYKPVKGRQVTTDLEVLDDRVESGIFSYSHYCPYTDPDLEVWFCKIPVGSRVYSNGWEYTSDHLIFLEKC